MIYLDSAATSFHKPKEVAEAVYDAILHMGNSGRSGHEISLTSSRVIFGTRKKLAALFGMDDPAQVVFTANSTQSLNIAISGLLEKVTMSLPLPWSITAFFALCTVRKWKAWN